MMLNLRRLGLLAAVLGVTLATLCAADAVQIPSDATVSSLVASGKAARARGANSEALAYFDAAVSKDPADYLTLFHRGVTQLSLGRNAQASEDFDKVLKIRPGFEGALVQRAKIRARNGDWAGARQDYAALGARATADLAQLEEAEGAAYLASEAEKKGDWETCINQAGIAIMTAGTAASLRQLRARCRFERGEVQEGLNDLAHVLQIHPGLSDPHLQISAMMFYSLGDTERGLTQVKKCLHSDPDSKPCKALFREEKAISKQIEKVQGLMDKRQFNSASKILTGKGTEDDPGLLSELKANIDAHRTSGIIHAKAPSELYTRLLEKTCEAYMSMNNLNKATKYCPEVLRLNPTSLHALLYQAQKHMENDNFDAAVATLNTARENHPDAQATINQKLQEAQTALKRSKTKDYYKVLGVSRDADERTIKKAYRTATKNFHPDKAAAKGVPKEEAEKKMAAINEAYEVLSDPELKARFDQGDDPNDPLANQQGGSPFQQGGGPFGQGGQQFFFQQGGFPGGGGGGSRGGGGQRQFKFSGGGFPGGGGGGAGGNPFAGFPGFG
ncbi:DnaJ like subfamily C member 3 [Capronia coronata CBS 617.96]|uniref:Tetratricopeptide repeat and J domain-containing co-chaperone DNJ1 n=1 Tax=Capronia coronata CBS 617.96 TaxID=1182541 RepID=W9YU35_9EURO|nr:DnaJ like subfamily C member 3 [Capronia coronata CBS 617.96]EXJ85794.1 DnaJ like subfamily C member 3 [Capronia coronata CBS 617.96]